MPEKCSSPKQSPLTVILMVRSRGTFLLLLVSVIASSLLFAAFVLRKADFYEPLYFPVAESADFQVRTLNEVNLPVLEAGTNKSCSKGTLVYGLYCAISPYASETRNTSGVGPVTLCTQGTVEFLKHLVVLCHRWYNPISVAVYSPLEDYEDVQIMVHLLRQCDSCVRHWVNWHFFFPRNTDIPRINEPQLTTDCTSITNTSAPKKRRSQGTYPINVGRNLARQLSSTPYVFSIDIELYPSLNIPAKFERMLQSERPTHVKRVWVVPVFEVHSKVRAPMIKSQLRALFQKRLAISFHQYRCDICHRIPNLKQWMEHNDRSTSEVEESLESLRVWTTVKRSRKFKLQEWEPFFIGTNSDPEFDVRLSWEGKQNKMQMAFEMCMQNYDFHIVENAFLVHSPGINVYNASKEKDREKHLLYNRKVIRMNRNKLIEKHGSKGDC